MAILSDFEPLRPTLLGVAYRMLGSAAEAEDAVQDVWLRWQGAELSAVRDARGWLCTAVGRICVDRLTSARARREEYPGTWLPEPVVTPEPIDAESISLGFLMLLERLTPTERAVLVLHQVFDYPHAEIAAALGSSEPAVRQAFHRAKKQLAQERPRFSATPEQHARLLQAFVGALTSGKVEAIASVLAEDVVLYADGGGKVPGAASRPVHGAAAIARFFAGLVARFPVLGEVQLAQEVVNGWPAMVVRAGGAVVAVITIETDGQRVTAIRNIVNPDKLALPRLG